MNHDDLVKCAAQWLEKTKRCTVIITEMASATCETPDAIGWQGARSIVVECKATRSDFIADGKKLFRTNPHMGMGCERYFMTLPRLIKIDELPIGWGLLELTASKIRLLADSQPIHEQNHNAEKWLLLSAIRRCGPLAPKGCSVRFYTMESKNRATLGVESIL